MSRELSFEQLSSLPLYVVPLLFVHYELPSSPPAASLSVQHVVDLPVCPDVRSAEPELFDSPSDSVTILVVIRDYG